MSAAQTIESFGHYQLVTRSIRDGCAVAMCFIDPMAPPCWDVTVAFNNAASDPTFNRTTQFFFLDTSNQKLDLVMEELGIGSVPMFAFFKAGEGVRISSGGAEILALIAENSQ